MSIQQKLKHELRSIVLVTLFFAIWLGIFMVPKILLLEEYQIHFGGMAYAYTEGDIFLNPVIRIEDGEFEMHTAAFKYIHAFELFKKSARVDLLQNFQSGSWSGLLNGAPAATEREGWADTNLRFAVNLYGAPPLAGEEFFEYRKATCCETIVGVGSGMTLPTGEYFEDKLINL